MTSARRALEQGFTLIELMIVVTIIGILAALCAPFLMSAKAAANESSAIGTMRALNSAQTAYSTACGGGMYATTFTILVQGEFASADMDVSPKSGFAFVLAPGTGVPAAADCVGNATQTAYYATATALSGNTGRRAFATNQDGTVWEDQAGVPPTEPFTIGPGVQPVQQ